MKSMAAIATTPIRAANGADTVYGDAGNDIVRGR